MPSFTESKQAFDDTIGKNANLPLSLVPVDGKTKSNIPLWGSNGKPLEEYYKWQFIFSLIQSDLYSKDYIGTEIRFPKGSKGAKDLKVDGAIFDDPSWLSKYNNYWKDRNPSDLQWLNDHMLGIIEFKRGEKEIDQVLIRQIKPAMKEKDPSDAYVLGIYYDSGRLFLFHRRAGKYLRYDEGKNKKGDDSQVGDLSLHLPDPYQYIPSFDELRNLVHHPSTIDRSNRSVQNLEVITSISTVQMQDALSNVLRTMDRYGYVNQKGYGILIQTFALKIFDEKRNKRNSIIPLKFYVLEEEAGFKDLTEHPIQRFIKRMKEIFNEAIGPYQAILERNTIDWQSLEQVKIAVSACESFQDFSFIRSSKSDLYQIIFYNFANKFQQQEKAQFLTPPRVIDFLVKIVNPRGTDTIFDPCCGIGDFLSLSYVNSQDKNDPWKLEDANIYGTDVSGEMISLALLNMLLNGDGKAHLFHVPDHGSILWKIKEGNPPIPVELIPNIHKDGNWDNWPNRTRLMKFDVILTNPPFGEDRAYRPKTAFDRQVIEMYETWKLSGGGDNIDLGVVFLENVVHCLKENGRMGIVLSNSIASINKWKDVREWLMKKMRIVALFDLPPNVFAETGVNTTLIVAYKPGSEEIQTLNEQNYSVFVREIHNVGYEKRTSKRNVFFNPLYKVDETTFETLTDVEGNLVLDEDFTNIVSEFRTWAITQEETLKNIFLKE
ncbi:N-6 DNA methylase [Methanosarcina sp. KYL-1]|uniref:HsdM family class I SAM-dependent methyltransferase n=1 Tax=Methanosarcina sp. KYL-1 TaxID=2602068 RepID=UPI00210199A9|nr:N-6 DNA methylase [Methanosarcina sp. KYL-1]MCQ1534816.1 N-6 DNA methylase [Methanosarcina sp. KYL-1]